MSQIDKVVYIPLLIWFWMFFFFLYFIFFSFFITYVYSIFRTRIFYIDSLINLALSIYGFSTHFVYFCIEYMNKRISVKLHNYFKNSWLYTMTLPLMQKYKKY